MRHLPALALVLLLILPMAQAQESPPPASRGDFVIALWEGFGAVPFDVNGPFTDVDLHADCAAAVAWAAAEGVVLGVGEACFAPDRPITREEAALLLRRMAGRLGRSTFLPDGVAACNDYADISPWADDSLYWATDVGLISWSEGGRLNPQGLLSADEVAQIFHRFFRESEKSPGHL